MHGTQLDANLYSYQIWNSYNELGHKIKEWNRKVNTFYIKQLRWNTLRGRNKVDAEWYTSLGDGMIDGPSKTLFCVSKCVALKNNLPRETSFWRQSIFVRWSQNLHLEHIYEWRNFGLLWHLWTVCIFTNDGIFGRRADWRGPWRDVKQNNDIPRADRATARSSTGALSIDHEYHSIVQIIIYSKTT